VRPSHHVFEVGLNIKGRGLPGRRRAIIKKGKQTRRKGGEENIGEDFYQWRK